MRRFSNADLKQCMAMTGPADDLYGGTNIYRAMARMDQIFSERHKLMQPLCLFSQQKDNNVVGEALNIWEMGLGVGHTL